MKTIIPFGDRVLVKRQKVKEAAGDKFVEGGLLVRPESQQEAETELAEIVYVPQTTFVDDAIVKNIELYVEALEDKMKQGDVGVFDTLDKVRNYLNTKSLKKGDKVMISKYIGTSFSDNKGLDNVTIVRADDIMGVIDER